MDNQLFSFLMSAGVNLRCQTHRKESITLVCQSLQCQRNPLICSACPDNHSDHASSTIQFSDWLAKVSKAIEEGVRVQKLFREENWEQVLKWCEDDEMHLKKVEEHCNAQRRLIEEDLGQLRKLFNEKCVSVKQQLDVVLADFNTKYKETFKSAKQTIEDSWLLFKSHSPYQNPTNLIFKLQQSTGDEAKVIVQTLKSVVQKIKHIESDKLAFQKNLEGIATKVTEMTCSLPVFLFNEGIEEICNQLVQELTANFKQKIRTPQQIEKKQENQSPKNNAPRQKQNQSFNSNRYLSKQSSEEIQPQKSNSFSKSPSRNTSTHQSLAGFQISANNKTVSLNQSINNSFSASDISLKPLKKYQLDFQLSAVEIINETLYALSCSNDSYLRIFDVSQKRIHTLQSHSNPITIICKSIVGEPKSNGSEWQKECKNKDPKLQQYLFTYSQDALIVWTFEGRVPTILNRQSFPNVNITCIAYLQDLTSLVLGDKDGGIEVYNFKSQKPQQACIRGKHSKSISSIGLIKQYDKFIVGSFDQTISIWRMLYTLSHFEKSYLFESAYCEQVVTFNSLGSVNSMTVLSSNSNYVLVGTLEGNFKLVNLLTGDIQIESETKNQNSLLDIVVCEDVKIKFKSLTSQICAIGLSANSKYLRFWKINEKEENWFQSEVKLEVAISSMDNHLKSKIQFTSMAIKHNNPLLLITNEASKELLVYEMVPR